MPGCSKATCPIDSFGTLQSGFGDAAAAGQPGEGSAAGLSWQGLDLIIMSIFIKEIIKSLVRLI